MKGVLRFLTRYRRSLHSTSNFTYWMILRGGPFFGIYAVTYTINGFINGWRMAYDVSLAIESPAEASVPLLAWPLSVGGWLAVPVVAGAIVAQYMDYAIEHKRRRAKPDNLFRVGEQHRLIHGLLPLIPQLIDLSEQNNRFGVRPSFVREFIAIHNGVPEEAEEHWELAVEMVLREADFISSAERPGLALLVAVGQAVAIFDGRYRPADGWPLRQEPSRSIHCVFCDDERARRLSAVFRRIDR